MKMEGQASLKNLPVELLPEILHQVIRPRHLASLCLVSKLFRTFAVEFLYRNLFIYAWHKDAKAKACPMVLLRP